MDRASGVRALWDARILGDAARGRTAFRARIGHDRHSNRTIQLAHAERHVAARGGSRIERTARSGRGALGRGSRVSQRSHGRRARARLATRLPARDGTIREPIRHLPVPARYVQSRLQNRCRRKRHGCREWALLSIVARTQRPRARIRRAPRRTDRDRPPRAITAFAGRIRRAQRGPPAGAPPRNARRITGCGAARARTARTIAVRAVSGPRFRTGGRGPGGPSHSSRRRQSLALGQHAAGRHGQRTSGADRQLSVRARRQRHGALRERARKTQPGARR
jgi:hypothetical protein